MHDAWMGMGWMGIFWLLLAIAIVVLVVLVSRRGSMSATGSPEELLKRRYARGEIDREQYQRMLEELRR